MDNNQNQQPNGYGMPQPNMQAGMPGQTPQPGEKQHEFIGI